MRIVSAFGVIPIPVIYTRRGFRTGRAGAFEGWGIRILPDHRDDRGLLAHEIEHAEQFWGITLAVAAPLAGALAASWPEYTALTATAGLAQPLLYRFSAKFRYWSELRAYRIQLGMAPRHDRPALRVKFAAYLRAFYRLDVPTDKILRDLA